MLREKSKNPHHRSSIRLNGFDYSSENGYFVTIVTQARVNLFGEIKNDEMALNDLGRIAQDEWFHTMELRHYVELFEDEFVVMPNHIHGIIWITDLVRTIVGAYCNTSLPDAPQPDTSPNQNQFRSPSIGLGAIIRGYKSAVTKRINLERGMPGIAVFQWNYYEHIIGSDHEYEQTAKYITNNPINWLRDNERNV